MPEPLDLAAQFDRDRSHLRAVAYRMLGSLHEADDAVQEAWLRASRADAHDVANVTGWLVTIVSRVCLDTMRTRRRRGEELADASDFERVSIDAANPEEAAALADSIGLAMLVVLRTLGPRERVAFVLHDLLAVPFDEIADVLEATPATAKKLASRARARVHEAPSLPPEETSRQRELTEAFLAASRVGDIAALLGLLAPDVVRRAERAVLRGDEPLELRGAREVAEETRTNADRARFARPVLVDGKVGAVVAPMGHARIVLRLSFDGDRITEIDVVSDPARLVALRLAALPTEKR